MDFFRRPPSSVNEELLNKIKWKVLSKNQKAIQSLITNFDIREEWVSEMDGEELSRNPEALPLLEKYPEKIVWKQLSGNPNAIRLIEEELKNPNSDKIDWISLARNPNPKAIDLIDEELKKPNPNPNFVKQIKHDPIMFWRLLSENPNAFPLLEKYPEKIDWDGLARNPNPKAIDLIEAQIKYELDTENKIEPRNTKINWIGLSHNKNPKAIDLIEARINYELDPANGINPLHTKIDWENLSENPNPKAVDLLKRYPEKIVWTHILSNTNPKAIDLIKKRLNEDPYFAYDPRLRWDILSRNPNAVPLLLEYPDKIVPRGISLNTNPKAIRLLEEYFEEDPNSDKIDWFWLSTNPSAINLLRTVIKTSPEKINWTKLSQNESVMDIISIDYKQIKKRGLSKAFFEGVSDPRGPRGDILPLEEFRKKQKKLTRNFGYDDDYLPEDDDFVFGGGKVKNRKSKRHKNKKTPRRTKKSKRSI